ncbi:REP-associated tyrosine transposase [Alcanivorax sp. IL3]|jgi:putative transposase|uniref:REP-associated tyrosine transposase n=1 Tax=unclassified Alcanivorax TaxID=2638842 RepID=UPI0039C0092C
MKTNKSPASARLRKGRLSIPGQIYLVTTTTHKRERCFDDFEAGCALCRSLHRLEALERVTNLSFVAMPDHLHWLFALGDQQDLSAVVRMAKSYSGRALGRSIWQPGFHDRAIRREADVLPAARYIVANPLRAGLVRSVRYYPFWYAAWL